MDKFRRGNLQQRGPEPFSNTHLRQQIRNGSYLFSDGVTLGQLKMKNGRGMSWAEFDDAVLERAAKYVIRNVKEMRKERMKKMQEKRKRRQ